MSASQRGTPFPAGRAQAPARVSSRRSTPAGYPSASERHSTRTPGQGQPTPTNTVSPARGPPLTPALPVSEGDVEIAPQAVPASTNQGDGTGPAVQVKPMTAKYLSSVWIAVIGVVVLNHGFRKVLSRPPITSGDISIAAVQWYSPKLLFLAHLLSHLSSSMAINAGMIVYLSFFLNPTDRLDIIDIIHSWLMVFSILCHVIGFGFYIFVISYTLVIVFWILFFFFLVAVLFARGEWSRMSKRLVM